MTTPRTLVYKVIDEEREYQESIYHETAADGQSGDGHRSIDEFAYYIDAYMTQLKLGIPSHKDNGFKLDIMRKVAAMAVACMEQNGTYPRR